MKVKLVLLFVVCAVAEISAQNFLGFVKRVDSIVSPIFQAKVEVVETGEPVNLVKTYFDGSYKFNTNKNAKYTLHVTYPGYTDTTFSFTTDKTGKPSVTDITVLLHKDGMRLLGVIKSKEEDFPIKEATISVKNIMTRKEDRITTDIDGYYNVKLDYETNYRVSIDKRSAGIFNKYKDTAFYISTVGFNQPLDYRLDISLDAATDTLAPIEGYHPKASKATKPVVEIKGENQIVVKDVDTVVSDNNTTVVKQETAVQESLSAAQLKSELDALKKELAEIKLKSLQSGNDLSSDYYKTKRKKRKGKYDDENLEVVVIRDTPAGNSASVSKKKENKKHHCCKRKKRLPKRNSSDTKSSS